ncbi:ATP synthase F1 subunit epsilon [bacterium]|nr:ATP synthase F1 subunit epsilon [bacterium]
MHLKIITHERLVFDEDVDEIYSRGTAGEFGVLPNHIPIMYALDIGVTKVVQNGQARYFATMGGVFQFKDNEAVILTAAAEDGNNIDTAKAQEEFERAKALLAEQNAEIDAKRAEAALARAMAKLQASLKG